MSQKETCICGAKTERLFAVLKNGVTANTALEDRFAKFGLCLSCTESLAGQLNCLTQLQFGVKLGKVKFEDELAGYVAKITKAGESGGEGEIGMVTRIYIAGGLKTATVVTGTKHYDKLLVNVQKMYDGGAETAQ